MVSVDKFYVYGAGRWREVDTSSGRIDGWGRAKFLVARGGKLEAARSKPLLAALRALADKKPSAAKEGPQLPYKYPRFKSRERAHHGCDHQCCHRSNSGSCTSKSNDKKASIAIQCNKVDLSTNKTDNTTTNTTTQNSTTNKPITTNNKTDTQRYREKRKRDSTSSEELSHKVVTVATVHNSKPDPKRRKISSNIRNGSTSSNETKPAKKSLQLRPLKRRHSSSSESIILASKLTRSRKKKKTDESQLRRSSRNNISIVISDDSDFEDSKGSRKHRQRFSTDEPLLKKPSKKLIEKSDKINGLAETSTDEQISSNRTSKSLKDDQIQHMLKKAEWTNEPKDKLRQNSSTDEPIVKTTSNKKLIKKASPKKNVESDEPNQYLKLGPRNIDNLNSQDRSLRSQKSIRQDTSKELIIDEKDVDILRLFIAKNFPDEDLLRFDMDDDYKRMHFYRINPLVNVERCPRIARMIQDSQDDRPSLVVFASKLGLRSVSEASSVKRYRTRQRKKKKYDEIEDKENEGPSQSNVSKAKAVRNERDVRENTIDTALSRKGREDNKIERYKATADRKKGREEDKAIDNAERKKGREDDKKERDKAIDKADRKKGKEDDKIERNNSKDTVNLSNGSGKVKVLKNKPKAISKRPPLNEYSNLEDHAIVSWISVGARACSVNGNRIWRELQDQFQRITGHARTWHSLRNRYLRYILPRLGALALPPSLQTRLRAAAATGELKAKRRDAKRNSIFKPPPRGAFSRRPGLVASDRDSEDEKEKEEDTAPSRTPRSRTPRYSDVTRQFARDHRYSSENSSNRETQRRFSPDTKNAKRDSSESKIKATVGISRSRPKDVRKSRNRSESRNSSSAKSWQRKSRKNSTDSNKSEIKRKHRKSRSPSDSSHGTDTSNLSDSDSSDPPEPPRRKSGRLRSRSPDRRKSNRIISPESNRRSQINSPEPNRRKSNRIISPESNRRNRTNSPEPNRRKSNRIISPESNRRSKINSPEPNRRKSNRIIPPEPNRLSRINSPEPNRRKSNRINSPESNRRNRTISPEPNRRKSNRIISPEPNRRKSNRINSPESNRRNRTNSLNQSSKNKSLDRQNKYRDSSNDSNDSSGNLSLESVELVHRRKSNRISSPETKKSNRVKSPTKTNRNSPEYTKRNRSASLESIQSDRNSDRLRSSSSSPSRRKSKRIKSESRDSSPVKRKSRFNSLERIVKSPIKTINSSGNSKRSRDSSPVKRKSRFNSLERIVKSPIKTINSSGNSKRSSNSLSESRRKYSNSPKRKSSRYKPETALGNSQDKISERNNNSSKSLKRTRKLFNPKDLL